MAKLAMLECAGVITECDERKNQGTDESKGDTEVAEGQGKDERGVGAGKEEANDKVNEGGAGESGAAAGATDTGCGSRAGERVKGRWLQLKNTRRWILVYDPVWQTRQNGPSQTYRILIPLGGTDNCMGILRGPEFNEGRKTFCRHQVLAAQARRMRMVKKEEAAKSWVASGGKVAVWDVEAAIEATGKVEVKEPGANEAGGESKTDGQDEGTEEETKKMEVKEPGASEADGESETNVRNEGTQEAEETIAYLLREAEQCCPSSELDLIFSTLERPGCGHVSESVLAWAKYRDARSVQANCMDPATACRNTESPGGFEWEEDWWVFEECVLVLGVSAWAALKTSYDKEVAARHEAGAYDNAYYSRKVAWGLKQSVRDRKIWGVPHAEEQSRAGGTEGEEGTVWMPAMPGRWVGSPARWVGSV